MRKNDEVRRVSDPGRRSDRPVERAGGEGETRCEAGVRAEARRLARGREARTPVLLAGVAGLAWIFIALISALVVLLWWLRRPVPTLLMVGERDPEVLGLNRRARPTSRREGARRRRGRDAPPRGAGCARRGRAPRPRLVRPLPRTLSSGRRRLTRARSSGACGVAGAAERLRRSQSAKGRKDDLNGSVGIGAPGGVDGQRARAAAGAKPVADDIAAQAKGARLPTSVARPRSLRNEEPVRDADGRQVEQCPEVQREAGTARMVAAGRIHEQHVPARPRARAPRPRGEGPPSAPGGRACKERRPRRRRRRRRRGGRAGGAPIRPTPNRPPRPVLTSPERSTRSRRRPRAARPPVARAAALRAPGSPAPEGAPRPRRARYPRARTGR